MDENDVLNTQHKNREKNRKGRPIFIASGLSINKNFYLNEKKS